jgi:hypothetical protein
VIGCALDSQDLNPGRIYVCASTSGMAVGSIVLLRNPFWEHVDIQSKLLPFCNGQMLIYDRKCFFRGSPVIFRSYFTSWHCMLYQRIHERFVCLLLPSGSHSLNFLRSECHSYITAHQCYQHGFTYRQTSAFLHEKTEI